MHAVKNDTQVYYLYCLKNICARGTTNAPPPPPFTFTVTTYCNLYNKINHSYKQHFLENINFFNFLEFAINIFLNSNTMWLLLKLCGFGRNNSTNIFKILYFEYEGNLLEELLLLLLL